MASQTGHSGAPARQPPAATRPRGAGLSAAWPLGLMLALAALSTAGCQQNACNGEPFRPQRGSPVIQAVSLSQPLAENPWQVVLNMNFLDAGGDLGGGYAFVYLQGSPQVARSFSLESYFRASELPLDATAGTVALYMMLPPDAFPDATLVQMDLQVEDASAPDPGGLFSNCYRMSLDFSVFPLASQARAALHQVGERAASGRRRAACWLYGCAEPPAL